MADSNGKPLITEIVTDVVVVAHIESCRNPDGTYKFKSLYPVPFQGRMCQLFESHPDLKAEVKRFDNKIKSVKKRFRHFSRQGNARLLSPEIG